MEEVKIGLVVKYFAKPEVAAIELTDGSLKVGDTIHITGHTTDFEQEIDSMQVDNVDVEQARKGDAVGIKVKERVRPHDTVYIVKGK
jgi:translation initiation factor IF-2